MRREVVIALAILGLCACGRGQEQSTTGGTAASEPAKTPASAPPSAPAGAAESAARPDVGAAPTEDVKGCLDLVSAGSYAQAVPVCTAALTANPANEQVKTALETAKTKSAEMAGQAAEQATGAAQGAAEDAASKAKEAVPAVPKTY